MDLLQLSGDGSGRAGLLAEQAADANFRVDCEGDEGLADKGGAALVEDMSFVFVAEIAERRQDGVRGGLAEPAERPLPHRGRQGLEAGQVGRLSVAGRDPGQDPGHGAGPDAAGGALAAGLFFGEPLEIEGDVHDAGVLVHDDHPAGAHHAPGGLQAFVVDGQVEHRFGDAAARRPADLDGLEFAAAGDAAADAVDDLPERDAHRHFDEAGVGDLADEREDLRAFARRRPERREPGRPAADDRRDVGPGLDVVDDRRLAPEPPLGRVGRALARVGPAALDRGYESGLLARDKGPGAADNLEVEIEARPQDVFSEEPAPPGLLEGFADAGDRQRVFMADVEKPLRCADGPGADDHPLDDGVRIGFEDGPVHERARVALVAVAHDVTRISGRPAGGVPLASGREPRAAPAAKARGGDLGDDRFRRHLPERLGRGGVAVVGDVIFDPLRVDPAAVAEDDQPLMFEELDVLQEGDRFPLLRRHIHQALDRPALDQVLLDEVRNVRRLEPLVEDAVGLDEEDRSSLAESVAARGHHEDLPLEAAAAHFVFEGPPDLEGPAGNAARPGADEEMRSVGRHALLSFSASARTASTLASLICP